MKRAIYIGKQIEKEGYFFNYGVTGSVVPTQYDGLWKFIQDDSEKQPVYFAKEDIYLPEA